MPEEEKTEISEETGSEEKNPKVETEEKPVETDEKPETTEETEEVVYTFGDEEPKKEEDSTVIRTLRKKLRETQKQLKEVSKAQEKKPDVLGPEPTLESCDMQEDRLKRELLEYHDRKREIEAKKKAEEEQQSQMQKQWDEKVVTYTEKRKGFSRPDFEEKEQVVVDSLGDRRTAAIIDVCGNSVEMIYALGSNPEKLKHLAETNDVSYMFELGRLSKEMKTITRKPTTTPERVVTGDVPVTSGEQDKEHERLLAESQKTGDLKPLMDYRRKIKEAGRQPPKF